MLFLSRGNVRLRDIWGCAALLNLRAGAESVAERDPAGSNGFRCRQTHARQSRGSRIKDGDNAAERRCRRTFGILVWIDHSRCEFSDGIMHPNERSES